MQKNFLDWHKEKDRLEQQAKEELTFHEREIWWCAIGLNLGDEQDGKNEYFERPVLVLKKFNRRLAWVLPLSTKVKNGIYYHNLLHDGRFFTILLSQMRLVSVKRFRRYVRKISPNQSKLIKEKIIGLIR